jgi:hypothetical protein
MRDWISQRDIQDFHIDLMPLDQFVQYFNRFAQRSFRLHQNRSKRIHSIDMSLTVTYGKYKLEIIEMAVKCMISIKKATASSSWLSLFEATP